MKTGNSVRRYLLLALCIFVFISFYPTYVMADVQTVQPAADQEVTASDPEEAEQTAGQTSQPAVEKEEPASDSGENTITSEQTEQEDAESTSEGQTSAKAGETTETPDDIEQEEDQDLEVQSTPQMAAKGSLNVSGPLRAGDDAAVYGIWDEETKALSFSTVKTSDTDVPISGSAREFIRSHTDAVSISFRMDSGGKVPVPDCSGLFSGFSSLQSVDLNGIDTSGATNMERMFYSCKSLKHVDLTGIDTSNVTNMRAMFYECSALTELDVQPLDTSKVTNMYMMMAYMRSLREIDLSSFDTKSVSWGGQYINGMAGLLFGNSSLISADLSGLDDRAYHRVLENVLTGCPELQRIVLGPEMQLKKNASYGTATYGVWGLDGVWTMEDDPSLVYKADDLYLNYDASSMAGTWIRLPEDGTLHYYRTDGSLGDNNIWEVQNPDATFKGYCINLARAGVGTYLDRVPANTDEEILAVLCGAEDGSTHGWAPLGSNMREAMVTLMYYGWPNDAAGIQAKYGLSHDRYMEITQQAIWDFTDRYDNKKGPSLFTGDELSAYNELLSQRYSNIGTEYELYLYSSWNPHRQSLLSLMSITDQVYGGVEVLKLGPNGEKVKGAVFTVYDADGNEAGTMTTNAGGAASIARTDFEMGLKAGHYTVKETKAPPGYELSDTVYSFDIVENNVIVTIGVKFGGSTDPVPMVFYDDEDEDYKGGGVMIQKFGDRNETLENAVFTIYDEAGKEVQSIRTNGSGIARTGVRDLPLGTYTVKETKAPAGYSLSEDIKTFTISNDGEYYSEVLTFTDEGKSGKISLEAKKIVEGGNLEEGQFKFQLQTAEGVILQQATNDANGKVAFDEIAYGPDDLGYVNYRIVEVIGNEGNINYDRHPENVTVMISDNGGDELVCTAVYDSDGAVFTNKLDAKKFKVSFRKIITSKKKPLLGAKLEILDQAGRVVDSWESGDDDHETEVFPGTYSLVERSAPNGYLIADPITFTVADDGTVTSSAAGSLEGSVITMKDDLLDAASFTLCKTDPDGKTLAGAEFNLTGTDDDGDEINLVSVTGEDGTATFSGLLTGTYELRETSAPAGYKLSDEVWTVNVKYDKSTAHSSNVNDQGEKISDYGNNLNETRTASVNGADKVHVRLTYQIEDGYDYLYMYDKNGNLLTEDMTGKSIGSNGAIDGGYAKNILITEHYDLSGDSVSFRLKTDQGTGAYGYFAVVSSTVIGVKDHQGNTVELKDGILKVVDEVDEKEETTKVSVKKVWEDNNNADNVRPSNISVQLTADGRDQGEPVILNADNGWTFTWKDLAIEKDGKTIKYDVTEKDIPVGYTVTYSGNQEKGFIITNTYNKDEKKDKDEDKDQEDGEDSDDDDSVTSGGTKTGDSSGIAGWSLLLLISVVSSGVLVMRKRRDR